MMTMSAADSAAGSSVIVRWRAAAKVAASISPAGSCPGAARDLVGGVLVADRGPRPAEGQGEGEPDIAQADDCHALRHAESLSGRQWLRSHADHRAARRARIGAPQPGVDPNHRRGGGWSLRRRAPQPSVSTGSSHSMRRGLIAGIDAAMPIRTAVPMMAIAAQTRRRVSSTGFRSAIGRHGDAGRRAGGRACCEAPHLFLMVQILVQRMRGRRGWERGFRAVIAQRIDWFQGRPPQ